MCEKISINTPVIGIPNWWWKKKAVRAMVDKPNIHVVSIKDFCHECSRHFELLSLFDSGDSDFVNTEYYQYQIKSKKDVIAIEKIRSFKKLYKNILDVGCNIPPIVTQDGCRIDGSHRMSILLHIGMGECKINVAQYNLLFSNKECQDIRKQVSEYRKRAYGFLR